jgi:hypothetical protein|tara:strand:+ start:120 stop:500 length:381 start_codon:yes stop_codon:yes gene_type:complete
MKTKKSSSRSFGVLFFLIFFLIGLWPLLNGENIRIWSILVSAIFLILGLLNSKILNPLKKSWIKIGEILGRVIAPVIMALIYFIILTPLSLIIKLFGKDLLKVKYSKINSYWINRKKNMGSMKKQF